MQHGIGELMGFKAGNNQYFVIFKVAGNAQWRTSQVHNLLGNLGLVATPYMENPRVIGFAQHDMDNHDFVKLIKQAHSSEKANRFHWASDSTASKVFKKLAANLSVPIMASQGSHRERKAPERLKMTEEPKKPRRKGPSAEEVQAKRQRLQPVERHYESEEEVDVSPPSTQEFGVFDNFIREATAEAQPTEAQPAVGPKETAPMVSPSLVFAQPAPADPPVDPPAEQAEQPVVEAVYMPNFSAVYEKVDTSTEIKRLEAHLADRDAEIKRVVDAKDKHLADKDAEIKRVAEAKDKHLADKDAEIKRLEEVFRLHLAEKDAALAARAKQIEILKGAVM